MTRSEIALEFMKLLVAKTPGEHPQVTAVHAFDFADAYFEQTEQREDSKIKTSFDFHKQFSEIFKTPAQSGDNYMTLVEVMEHMPPSAGTISKLQMHLKKQGYENKLFRDPYTTPVRKYRIAVK